MVQQTFICDMCNVILVGDFNDHVYYAKDRVGKLLWDMLEN